VLGTTLWFVVVMALMATVLMNGAAAFGRAGVQAAADHAVEAALHDALADYQNQLRPVLASESGATGALANQPLPTVSVTPAPHATGYGSPLDGNVTGNPNGAGFTVGYDVTPTTVVVPSCNAPAQNGADTVAWLQCHALVRESRASLRITVRVFDASGTQLLAQRGQTVTLRLFALPPYSAVVGRADGAADSPTATDALSSPAHEGDVSSISDDASTGAGTVPAPSPWPQGGSLIHVRYQCDGGDCADAAPPDPDAALRAGARWTNGNAR
jgi:hypothetical protein